MEMAADEIGVIPHSLLLVDDDEALLALLSVSMADKGFSVSTATSVTAALNALDIDAPDFALIDLSLRDGSGLAVAEHFRRRSPRGRFLIMSGYGDISNAVAATRLGASDFLVKPVNPNEVAAVFAPEAHIISIEPPILKSAQRVRWEHIQAVHLECAHNVSKTARRLHMHRRTLQRILAKNAPR